MKRKSLTMILCLLTCLSLVGVGFAAWVITAPAQGEAPGNIVVDTVEDKRLSVAVELVGTNKDIILNGPSTNSVGTWLTYKGSKVENRSVSYKCTVSYKDSTKKFTAKTELNDPTVTFTAPKNTAYSTAVEKGCFALASGSVEGKTYTKGVNVSELTVNASGAIEFTITVKYVWGSAFENENPFDCYSDKNISDDCGFDIEGNTDATWGDHAAYYLGLLDAIDASGNDVDYNLTVQVTPVA